MFTGIVEEIGLVAGINRTRAGACLKIKGALVSSDVKIGDSIAIDGVCLSVTDVEGTVLIFDVIYETLKRTTLGRLKINKAVNLERSLKADSRMGGHFVSGHVDYTGRIIDISRGTQGTGFRISLPDEFSRFIVKRGSVAVDGVSLTVSGLARESFSVYLIPHTLKNTILGQKNNKDSVNVEMDLLAKYIAKQRQGPELEGILKEYGYVS